MRHLAKTKLHLLLAISAINVGCSTGSETHSQARILSAIEDAFPARVSIEGGTCSLSGPVHNVIVYQEDIAFIGAKAGEIIPGQFGNPGQSGTPHAFVASYICGPNLLNLFLFQPASHLYAGAFADRAPQFRTHVANAAALLAATQFQQCRLTLSVDPTGGKIMPPGTFYGRQLTPAEAGLIADIFRAFENRVPASLCGAKIKRIPTLFLPNGA